MIKNFLQLKQLKNFVTTPKPNSVNFALHLFLSRKYYLEYLASNEFKDDRYILPLLNIYNQNLYVKLNEKLKSKNIKEGLIENIKTEHQFIVLENIDGEIMIKYKVYHIYENYKKY